MFRFQPFNNLYAPVNNQAEFSKYLAQRLYDTFDAIHSNLQQLATTTNQGPSIAAGIITYTLIAPTTLINLPPASFNGGIWILLLNQDNTGGRVVTFDPLYTNYQMLPEMLLTSPNTYSAFTFYARPDGKQIFISVLTNQPL